MSIETDLKRELRNNTHELYLTEVDDLIAVWRYRKCNQFTRSVDFSRVPEQWRYAAPPVATDNLLPCHISYRLKGCHGYSQVQPALELSFAASCHNVSAPGLAAREIPSLTELDAVNFAKRNVAPYISPILDAHTLALVCKDLGLNGRAVPKIIKGRQYVIFKGYPGVRKLFPATKYLADNSRIVRMGIGKLGIKDMVKGGGELTIFITVSLTILEYFLKDQFTMSALVGKVASDLVKVGISSIIAALAGLAVGTCTTIVALPILTAIGVGIAVGAGLEWVDTKYKLTDQLVAALKKLGDQMAEVEALVKAGQYSGREAQLRGLHALSNMRFNY